MFPHAPHVMIVGFVGTRFFPDESTHDTISIPETGYSRVVYSSVRDIVLDLKQKAAEKGNSVCGISALALGSDLIFAQVLRELGIPHRIVLPQPADSFFSANDFGSPEAATRIHRELDAANVIDVEVASTASQREKRFRECGHRILWESDVFLTVNWPGKIHKPCGTRETLQSAKAIGRQCIEVELKGANETPDVFNCQRSRTGEVSTAKSSTFDWAVWLAQTKQRLSGSARIYKQLFQYAALSAMLLHLAATAIALIPMLSPKLKLAHPYVWPSAKLVGLTIAFVLVLLTHVFHLNRGWSKSRLMAELARSFLVLRRAPIKPLYLEDLRLPELSPELRSMITHHLVDRKKNQTISLESFRSHYVDNRIRDQLTYFEQMMSRTLTLTRVLETTFYFCSGISIAIIVGKLLHLVPHTAGMELLPILLPMVAASAISWVSICDLDRRITNAGQMIRLLKEIEPIILNAPTEDLVQTAVHRTERALLQSTVEWYYRQTDNRGH